MSELRELYQELILDHGKSPRNRRALADADCCADGHNPLCGDRIRLYVKTEQGRIVDVAFEGSGCAISTASASMMSQALKGKTVYEVEALFKRFHDMVTGRDPLDDAETEVALGKLAAFSGVREFPVRVKCATLAWHTLLAALESGKAGERTVTTE